ncbi:MAG: hypothetical protein WBY88_01915 [Desulfosarcina sp.]
MLHTGYSIGGVIVVALLIGYWTLKRSLLRSGREPSREPSDDRSSGSPPNHDIEHQAIVFLMNQKFEAMLAALSRTIDAERRKLGPIVRKPSIASAIERFNHSSATGCNPERRPYEQILPMAENGRSVSAIARQLKLSEAEVATVVRLNAA